MIKLSSLNGSSRFRLDSVAQYDSNGWSVASAGDINGDGFADLIIGSPQNFSGGSGRSYVVFGKTSGFASNIDLSTRRQN